jgi:hypothetical protein
MCVDDKLAPNYYQDRGVIYTYFFKRNLDCYGCGIKSFVTIHDRSRPLQTLSTLVTGLVPGLLIKNLRGILTMSEVYVQSTIATVGSQWSNDKNKRTT